MSMGAQRAEAQQPSIGLGETSSGAGGAEWGFKPFNDNQEPHLPWSGAAEEAAPNRRLLARLLIGAGVLWLVVTAWAQFADGGGQALTNVLWWLALASGPLALLALAWLLARPTAPQARQESGFAGAASAMSSQGAQLDQVLASVGARLSEHHGRLTEETERLMLLGDEASDRIGRVAHHLSKEGAKLDGRTEALERAASHIQQGLEVLLADLPKAEERARQVSDVMKEAGLSAHAQAGALESQLSALIARGREADEVVGGAAQRLGAHLTQVESTTETATARLRQAAEAMTTTVDGSMERAAEAVDAARTGLEAQGAAMLAMIEQSRAALGGAGEDAARALSERLDVIGGRVEGLAASLAEQDRASRNLVGTLSNELGELERRFGALGNGSGVDAIRTGLQALGDEIAASNDRSAVLLERAQQMAGLMKGVSAQLEADLPMSLEKVEHHAGRARAMVEAIAPNLETMAGSAETAAGKLRETELSLASQQQQLETMLARLGEGVGTAEQQVRALAAAAAEADVTTGRMAATTGPELIEVLVRVREAAAQAAERARETIAAVIPESAAALGAASRRAIGEAIGTELRTQLTDLEMLAVRTVDAARRASERLTRQMLTIGEATAAVEERIDDARTERETKESESFSRRVALLIESLNSTAIDVTKILSNEVTDSAWAAYLKGDRGVFTRRAVRLIDVAEAREILAHYEAEPEFREQVNRYIHDFEAMLRRVLADREGSALGVTLLGSDMGKLYVALAQAIERLRA